MRDAKPASQPKSKNAFQNLLGIIIKPRATLAYLSTAKKSGWWLPVLLTIIVAIVVVMVNGKAQSAYAYQIQLQSLQNTDTPLAKDMGMDVGMEMPPPESTAIPPITLALQAGGKIFGALFGWLLWAGTLYLATTLLGQNGAGFGAMFKLIVWAAVPYIVRGALQAIFIAATGAPIYNPGLSGFAVDNTPQPAIFDPYGYGGYAMPDQGKQVLAALLSGIDLFLIWNLALLTLGLRAFTKLTFKKALLAVLLIWAVLAGLGALPAMFSGVLRQFLGF